MSENESMSMRTPFKQTLPHTHALTEAHTAEIKCNPNEVQEKNAIYLNDDRIGQKLASRLHWTNKQTEKKHEVIMNGQSKSPRSIDFLLNSSGIIGYNGQYCYYRHDFWPGFFYARPLETEETFFFLFIYKTISDTFLTENPNKHKQTTRSTIF